MEKKDTVQKIKTDKKREPSQRERFIDAALAAEADDSGNTFLHVFQRVVRPVIGRRNKSEDR